MAEPRPQYHGTRNQSLPSPDNPLVPGPESKMIFDDWLDTNTTNPHHNTHPAIHIWEECFEDVSLAPVTDEDIKDALPIEDGNENSDHEEVENWEVLAQPFWVSTVTHAEVYTRPEGEGCLVVQESGNWEEGSDFCDRPFYINSTTLRETKIKPQWEGVVIKPSGDLKRLTARATAEMEERLRLRRRRGVPVRGKHRWN